MLMNTVVGIRSVPLSLHDLMRASRATRWQMFIKLEIPASMPVLITGLKTSATLAVIGAVVGEFVTASSGLGFWVKLARDQYDTPLVFKIFGELSHPESIVLTEDDYFDFLIGATRNKNLIPTAVRLFFGND